ncbi:MAG: acylneuraminate cytidylyltransferase family protein [Firmicutes bacterium]|nr:acylneuraminate cytidylyltransferase family protein [Bacillota bacterium]MCM1401688.1 acylneuraminate cytidylyltransferase family protein [Bacteroides sp.]MCM1477496.1 acylneuraminate cytidylyltransferase family protein [Bacteroides sp.]
MHSTTTPPHLDTLFIIPARGGSKGIPGKNIKPLAGKPLIHYAIETARALAPDSHIVVSTDSEEIARVAGETGLPVPYRRPAALATDTAGSREVMLHAMEWATEQGITYNKVCLLQPTSPLRSVADVEACLAAYTPETDMAVSTVEVEANPYYNCFEPDPATGYLHISKGSGLLTRRQDAPPAWQYSGAVYVINPASLRAMPMGSFPRRVGVPMDRRRAVDLDTPLDWAVAEAIINHNQTSQPLTELQ